MATMTKTTVQLIAVRPGVATVRVDDRAPSDVTWEQMREAMDQQDDVRHVYGWMMREYSRCEYSRRQGVSWESPARDAADLIAEGIDREVSEAAARERSREDREREAEARRRRLERSREEERVLRERRDTKANDPWWPIPSWEVPEGIRFDTLARDQGQIVEVSYGTFSRYEADESGPFMRVVDHSGSDGPPRYYRRREV